VSRSEIQVSVINVGIPSTLPAQCGLEPSVREHPEERMFIMGSQRRAFTLEFRGAVVRMHRETRVERRRAVRRVGPSQGWYGGWMLERCGADRLWTP